MVPSDLKYFPDDWVPVSALMAACWVVCPVPPLAMLTVDIVVLIATEEGPAQLFERQIHDYRQPLIEYIDKYA